MSRRIILTPDKVTPSLYDKLMKLGDTQTQNIIVEIFRFLQNRRKCYKLNELNFHPHATEYYIDDFFHQTNFSGITKLEIQKNSSNINFIHGLTSLANIMGVNVNYEGVINLLESINTKDLKRGDLIEIIPELLYSYTTQFKPTCLVLKLEYFFGSDVISVLRANGFETNTGSELQFQTRAITQADQRLKKRQLMSLELST